MHRRVVFFLIIASLAMGLVGQRISAQDRSGHPLIKGVTDAKVTLQQGLTAASQQVDRFRQNSRLRTGSSSFRFTPQRMGSSLK